VSVNPVGSSGTYPSHSDTEPTQQFGGGWNFKPPTIADFSAISTRKQQKPSFFGRIKQWVKEHQFASVAIGSTVILGGLAAIFHKRIRGLFQSSHSTPPKNNTAPLSASHSASSPTQGNSIPSQLLKEVTLQQLNLPNGSRYKLNGKYVLPDNLASQEVKKGQIVQVDNTIYKMTLDEQQGLKPFKISDNAEMVSDLCPSGIHAPNFKQHGLPSCAKLTMAQTMILDPTGRATHDLLSCFKLGEDLGNLGKRYTLTDKDGYQEEFILKDGKITNLVKGNDKKGVQGDPLYQMLEYYHYRKKLYQAAEGWYEEKGKSKQQFLLDIGTLRDQGVYTETNLKIGALKIIEGNQFAKALLGNKWTTVSFDGTQRSEKEIMDHYFYDRKSFQQRMNEDTELNKRVEKHFDEIEKKPGQFLYCAQTLADDGGDAVLMDMDYRMDGVPLKERDKFDWGSILLKHQHSYYFNIERDSNGKRIFVAKDPYSPESDIVLSEYGFLRHFCVLNGIKPI